MTATAKICDVEKHVWVGFLVNDYMQDKRYAYVTVYFSHGGSWSGIEQSKFL